MSNLEPPSVDEIIHDGFVFQKIEKGYDYYTKLGPVELHNNEPKVTFLYRTSSPYMVNPNDREYSGVESIGYFSHILLKLEDDYTFDDKIIFKKSDYPNGIVLTGMELYWLNKEQYNYLKSKFNTHMLAGLATVLSGPELAVAKGWRLVLAILDFQLAIKSFANTTPQYQQLLATYPSLKAYNDAWDNFNKVYGVCRITQGVAELGILKWQSVKNAANDLKNDASVPASIKNQLKIDEIIVGTEVATLVNSLKAKLGQTGYDLLQAWKANKAITFIDDFNQSLSGVAAENAMFANLEKEIGNKQILGTSRDLQDRFVVQFEGANRNSVLAILKNKDGQFIIKKFEPTYKPTANLEIDVAISENKLVPDYTKKMNGQASTEYLYPQNLLPAGKSPIVRIKMTGKRSGTGGDFNLANIEAGLPGINAPANYVWHHMDDFEIINGEAWCTMQLVKTDAHTQVAGMAHSGSVAQWKAYYGSKENAPLNLFY